MDRNRKIILVFSFFSLLVFGTVMARATLYSSSEDVTPAFISTAFAKDKNPTYPNTLSIPSLDINAKVQQVGITTKGRMATPSNFKDVGWYRYGAKPGENGTAVIDGHLDNGLAFPAVFNKLGDIKVGDDIYVTNGESKTLHYVVTGSTLYDFNAEAVDVFAQNKNEKTLKLITCAGNWIDAFRTHDKRLVVSATLV